MLVCRHRFSFGFPFSFYVTFCGVSTSPFSTQADRSTYSSCVLHDIYLSLHAAAATTRSASVLGQRSVAEECPSLLPWTRWSCSLAAQGLTGSRHSHVTWLDYLVSTWHLDRRAQMVLTGPLTAASETCLQCPPNLPVLTEQLC